MNGVMCPKCGLIEAPIHAVYGVVWCDACNASKPALNGRYPEFIPDRIKEDRKRFARDLLQPWREGEASREFIEAYPQRAAKMFTPREIQKAKNVWKGDI